MQQLLRILSIVLFPFLVGILLDEIRTPVHEKEFMGVINPDHLDGPFTGGFGELTCHTCHFDYDLNMEGGNLTTEGIPDQYEAGELYNITIGIQSEQLEIGGFQLTARFLKTGEQAGSFSWTGDRLRLTPESSVGDSIQYIQHSMEGTSPTGNRTLEWSFTWIAPETAGEPVLFNIASNAGNYDDSSFGDRIYVKEFTSRAAE